MDQLHATIEEFAAEGLHHVECQCPLHQPDGTITQVAKHGACRPPPGPQGPGVGCRARWPQVGVIKTPAELCLRYVTNAGRFAHFKLSKPKIEIWAEDLVRLWGSDNQWAALQRVGH